MKRFILLLLLMFGAVAPNIIHGQNNRISIHTGLFHCFFDGSPLLNVNYRNKAVKPFGGLLYNSVGLQYTRTLNQRSVLSFEAMLFSEYYWNVHPNLLAKQVSNRDYMTYNVSYHQILPLSNGFQLTYGGGLNFRYGSEGIVVNYAAWGGGAYESLMESRMVSDIGINLRTGIEYSPLKWLTLYTKLDLLGFVYAHDRQKLERLKEMYNVPNYPNRFDLSWRFGLGFNFGKSREGK